MKDNLSNFHSNSYDNGVRQVIPYYPLIHQEAVNIIRAMDKRPEIWLDTGCGTGHLVSEALLHFPGCRYELIDPSPGMLEKVRERFAEEPMVSILDPCASEDLPGELAGKADVVSAMFCHHYRKLDEQKDSVSSCLRVLRPGGVFLTAVHCASDTEIGDTLARKSWTRFQTERGRSAEEINAHFGRLGDCLYLYTVDRYKQMLEEAGFRTVELFWRAGMQCGFFAIR